VTIGDVLEWLAAACLVAAAYLWSGWVLTLAVAGVSLAYFAQVYDRAPKPQKVPEL
jgi:hypothetical protein